jgi:hypothetical protein
MYDRASYSMTLIAGKYRQARQEAPRQQAGRFNYYDILFMESTISRF